MVSSTHLTVSHSSCRKARRRLGRIRTFEDISRRKHFHSSHCGFALFGKVSVDIVTQCTILDFEASRCCGEFYRCASARAV